MSRAKSRKSLNETPTQAQPANRRSAPLSIACRFGKADCIMKELAGSLKVQFFFDPSAVAFHRLHAEIQLLGDLGRAVAAPDEPKNVQLPITESVNTRGGRARPPPGDGV